MGTEASTIRIYGSVRQSPVIKLPFTLAELESDLMIERTEENNSVTSVTQDIFSTLECIKEEVHEALIETQESKNSIIRKEVDILQRLETLQEAQCVLENVGKQTIIRKDETMEKLQKVKDSFYQN
jgi:hypothetical protein